MKINVDNLYSHPDGGLYCLLIPDAKIKHPDTGEWMRGVIYTDTYGRTLSTTWERWDERFTQVPNYDGDDEGVLSMVRRANPGDIDLDFVRVFESWHQSEVNITGNMLELAVAAVIEQWTNVTGCCDDWEEPFEITIKTEDLQRILQTYQIDRFPIPHGFTFRMSKPEIISA